MYRAIRSSLSLNVFLSAFVAVTFVSQAAAQQLSGDVPGTNGVSPSGGVISFLSSTLVTQENKGSAVITVQRTGDTSQAVTVHYETADQSESLDVFPCSAVNGLASSRCDYTTAIGTLRFASGENSKTFKVLISEDSYVEGLEGVQVILSNPTNGAVLGTPSTATLEISDDRIRTKHESDQRSEHLCHPSLSRLSQSRARRSWSSVLDKRNLFVWRKCAVSGC